MKWLYPKDISVGLWMKSGLCIWNFQDIRATKICLVHSLIFQMGKTEARGVIPGLGCATDPWLAGPPNLVGSLTLSIKVSTFELLATSGQGDWVIK